MRNVVLTSPATHAQARQALLRALDRLPASVEDVAYADRPRRLIECAADPDVEFVVIVDDDVVLHAAAFGALRRTMTERTAMAGGRAMIGALQCFGDLFAPPRSGPNPFELAPIIAPADDRASAEFIRGPIDVPQRGAYVVSAAFVRALGAAELDPTLLHLDLAVAARAAGFAVACEPSLAYSSDDDPAALRRALGDLRRYAGRADWHPDTLHREPLRGRPAVISREVRVMGNIRGYVRRTYPPIDVLVTASDEMGRARALRAGTPLAIGGRAVVCDPGDGDALRAALARTSDRYVLVADASAMPERARIEVLAERLERSGRNALALESADPPYGVALFHCGRIVNGSALAGETVADVIAAAVDALPLRRMFAIAPGRRIVPVPLPRPRRLAGYDIVFVAAARPVVTDQTIRAALGDAANATLTAIYPAGAKTTERMLSVHSAVVLAPDASDVHLAVGLNRALGSSRADAVAIIRDDAQLPHGVLDRLADAFRRVPGLGIAVPRVGGNDRPESLPDLGYRSSAEMQLLYDRRAEAYARESTLLDVATAPVMMISREALGVIGGFDEMFGFSRLGVEDFSRRARTANFLVACCEDAYAHLFTPDDAQSFLGNLDAAPFLRAAYEKRWSSAHGFDPETDRVPLRDGSEPDIVPVAAPSALVPALRILVPIGTIEQWQRTRPLLAELAAAFRVSDPVEIAIGLDGTFGVQAAVGAMHELLTESGVPMEETINVSIDFVGDHKAWRDASANNVCVAGLEREILGELPSVADAAAVRALIAVPVA